MKARPAIPLTGWRTRRGALPVVAAGLAALAGGRGRAVGQDATPDASGVPAGFLFVQAFDAGILEPVTGTAGIVRLTLREGVSRTLYVPDRSGRQVGVVPTDAALAILDVSGDDPPNAALVAERAGDGATTCPRLDSPSCRTRLQPGRCGSSPATSLSTRLGDRRTSARRLSTSVLHAVDQEDLS